MALLALTLALLAMTMATMAIMEKPLDMALDSFDDQYRGCRSAMMEKLPALNHSEFQKNPLFAKVWPKAVHLWKVQGSPQYPLSSSDQAIALMAYTMNDLYQQFNNNVSVAGRSPQTYRDNFHFKTLHFLLTDALATLRVDQGQKCHCVFRGVDDYKFKANVGDTVRFGRFASSSLCRGVAKYFGSTTEFVVRTCHGADIKNFSNFEHEKEVLIPPFEKFKVTKVIEGTGNVQIHLDSIGTYSKYNCGSVSRALAISSWSSQPWQWPQGSSEPQSLEDICGHCYNKDSQRNKATKSTKATIVTMATLATMASVWSLWPPLAL
ncbi:erythroblast NAD(P)(+)--arginine ADP-ribosyltransferase-like isoform X2 [Oenanthe melanoleuca]|uniref:erythroblast NAD(P)(+)--arginine ADP-ribosyltransferase-like isoform X2 n=1 Tax=Oenanthe melanoleuca TaxID=2939378 RepID=UPI0024C17613|nr:erythroblast NAD(P)(+)--arginine ADP-ribosyltransferase-like isoform X2 [Oenanthe melanoleuca]